MVTFTTVNSLLILLLARLDGISLLLTFLTMIAFCAIIVLYKPMER